MLGVVIQIDGYDPVAAAVVTLRAASRDDVSLCNLNGQIWWPAIAKLPTLRYDLFDGAFGGQITAPSSILTLVTEAWANFGRYALADARLRLWTGELGAAWAGYTLRFDGRISDQPQMKDGQASISFAVDDRWLDKALLSTYAGTTGAEGVAALKGQVKPIALGAPRYVAGTLIDTVNNVFQVSAGPVRGVTAALDRLVRYGAPVADYPTYAALVAATVARGTWATANSVGMARLGAPAEGQVSFLVEGDNGGTDGWARKPGQLIRRLAILSGGAGKIDNASLDRLDAARPYLLSLDLDQQTTAREVIQKLAASVNAVAGVSWTGSLFVAPIELATPNVTLAADGSSLPPVSSVEQVSIAPPWGKLAIGAERTWSVHALSDIAFTATLLDLGAYSAGTTYREGNIVQEDGSSWLYTNAAPSAGNAPPQLPVESNLWWSVLAKAGVDGSNGINGGGAFTLLDIQYCSDPGPATVTKRGGGENWNAKARTAESGAAATVSGMLVPGGFIGLTTDPYAGFGYAEIDYAIHWSDDTGIFVWRNGVKTTGIGLRPTENGPVRATIRTDGRTLSYAVEGFSAPAGHPVNGSGETVYGTFALLHEGSAIGGITFSVDGKPGSDGANAPLVKTQWSINGVDNWHDNYFGADAFQRQSNDNGVTYGPAVRVVGEGGDDGVSPSQVFIRSATVPAAPANNSGNPPTGWYDGPPAGTDFIWQSSAKFQGGTQLSTWTTPQRISGTDGFGVITSPPAFVIPSFSNGTTKPAWQGGSCRIALFKGGQEVAADSYTVVAGQNVSSLAMNGQNVTFADIVGDKGEFTARATRGGVSYDQRVTIVRTLDGAAAFRSSAQFTSASGGTGAAPSTTVPGGRTVRIAASASYSATLGNNGRGTMLIYWSNLTDGGPENFLAQMTGSMASRRNIGTGSEPEYENVPGSVSVSATFTSPSPDKLIQYRAAFAIESGAPANIAGSVSLEVVS